MLYNLENPFEEPDVQGENKNDNQDDYEYDEDILPVLEVLTVVILYGGVDHCGAVVADRTHLTLSLQQPLWSSQIPLSMASFLYKFLLKCIARFVDRKNV